MSRLWSLNYLIIVSATWMVSRSQVCPSQPKTASAVEIANAVAFSVQNITLQLWCDLRFEEISKDKLAEGAQIFCASNNCPALSARRKRRALTITAGQVHLLPGHPEIKDSFLVVRFYILTDTGTVIQKSVVSQILIDTTSTLSRALDRTQIFSPVDGQYTEWSNFACSVTCGSGTAARTRTCTNPPPSNGGKDCTGPAREVTNCQFGPLCPIHGGFTLWSAWQSCDKTCGEGRQTRTRTCTNPPPSLGGRPCNGNIRQQQICQQPLTCPPLVDGKWGQWGPFGACSKTCGIGQRTRTRKCDNPPPKMGGADCIGSATDSQQCNLRACAVDGGWSVWSIWRSCTRTCGLGTRTRTRRCDSPAPANNGKICQGNSNDNQECYVTPCTSSRMYPFGPGRGDQQLNSQFASDMAAVNSPSRQPIRNCQFTLLNGGVPFFERIHRKVYICPNGMVRFTSASSLNFPEIFPGRLGRFRRTYIMTPYWADVNLDQAFTIDAQTSSKVYYHFYDQQKPTHPYDLYIFLRATSDVRRFQTNPRISKFVATKVLVVTWQRMYNAPSLGQQTSFDKSNTFQLVVISDTQNTFARFNYPVDGLRWSNTPSARKPTAGYNAGDNRRQRFFNLPGSSSDAIQMLDDRTANTNLAGIWFFALSQIQVTLSPRTKCLQWYRSQRRKRIPYLTPCPKTLNQARYDRRFTVDYNGKISKLRQGLCCAYSKNLSPRGQWIQQCCYTRWGALKLGAPNGGSPQIYKGPSISDQAAYDYCCVRSRSCATYYHARPSRSSAGYWPQRHRCYLYGDPHFTTLDGKNFTFNGLGEYVILSIDNGTTFELQARTVRARGGGLATIISAAALKEANSSTISVYLTDKGELDLYLDGAAFNLSALFDDGTSVNGSNIALSRDENGTITVVFRSGISASFANVKDTLAIDIAAPDEFRGRTKGLMGTWNNNTEDDFLRPDGMTLPADASPQKIHYEFGLKWQIQPPESLFTYKIGQSALSFVDLDYRPMFIDNITWPNDDIERKALAVCGNNTNCLYDIAVTSDTSFGESTKEVEEKNEKANKESAISPPDLYGPSVINATIGKSLLVNITVKEHSGDSNLTFYAENVPSDALFVNTSKWLLMKWTPSSIVRFEPIFTVSDETNSSAELRPVVRFCACKNGGKCVEDEEVEAQRETGSRFLLLSCACPQGLTGQFCESDLDACEEHGDPCFPSVLCEDLPPPADADGFKCGACPIGYTGNGTQCTDINECLGGTTRCSQACVNTPGSYSCSCYDGYQLTENGTDCQDIDECRTANDCQQKCNNYPGGYNCSCLQGFESDPTDSTNCNAKSLCDASVVGCQQTCFMVDEEARCSCQKGFKLGNDQKSCEDINECVTGKHKCSHLCMNSWGGYECACKPGYRLEVDQKTCKDINECYLISPVYCSNYLEKCVNTPGSFRCECIDGFQEKDGKCEESYHSLESLSRSEREKASVQTVIKDANFSEWRYGLAAKLGTIISELAKEAYSSGKKIERLFYGDLAMSSAELVLLQGYPHKEGCNLVVAFYVQMTDSSGKVAFFPKTSLLKTLRSYYAEKIAKAVGKELSEFTSYTARNTVKAGEEQDKEEELLGEQKKDQLLKILLLLSFLSVAVITILIAASILFVRQHKLKNTKR